jgi:Acyl-CoA synthetases (AMP-forming)/AMP-acid ligases II
VNENRAKPALEVFEQRLLAYASREMVWFDNQSHTYEQILQRREDWKSELLKLGVGPGTVCAFAGDYWPHVIAFILALINVGAVAVPFSLANATEIPRLCEIAKAEHLFRFDQTGSWTVERLAFDQCHPLVADFRNSGSAGLIVFSSGSTGSPKGILHDFERLLSKFMQPRRSHRTLMFLLLDHLGGINTLLSVLTNGGVCVVAKARTPDAVGATVEAANVELLPVTPSFLSMLFISGALDSFDFSSVSLVTYGTEPMPEQTLQRATARLPNVRFQQTFGLSEIGVLHSKSLKSSSLLMRIGGEGFETQVREGVLWIRSASAMVGYLNAPDPFDKEGWLNTGDVVVMEGDYLRVLGRESDIINVGGQKVFPAEVEEVLLQAGNVLDVSVSGEKHPLMGSVVTALVELGEPEDQAALKRRLRAFSLQRLAPYKVPAKFAIADRPLHNHRFKKMRGAKVAEAH